MIKHNLINKKVLVLGLGLSGKSAIKLLKVQKAKIYFHDDQINQFNDPEVYKFDQITNMEKENFNLIIKSPGIPIENPYVNMALKLKIPLVTELEFASWYCKAHLIGVTGTNGKTTVTTLIAEMLKKSTKNCVYKAGNIGIPLSEVSLKAQKNDYVVCECSSFQLEFTEEFHPEIALINNTFPHHLEHHHTYKNYLYAKSKIFANQTHNNYLIINGDQKDLDSYIKSAKSKIVKFGLSLDESNSLVYLKNKTIYSQDSKICATSLIKIPGLHNVENILAAATVAKILGVSNQIISEVAESFPGVEHRLEYVGEKSNRKFYNDSKATDEEATIVALKSMKKPIILIAGGMDRGDKFPKLGLALKNVKLVELFGENQEQLRKVINSVKIKTVCHQGLTDAFNDSFKRSEPGDTILLSPASASWDQFESFEARGKEFKELYRKLKP